VFGIVTTGFNIGGTIGPRLIETSEEIAVFGDARVAAFECGPMRTPEGQPMG